MLLSLFWACSELPDDSLAPTETATDAPTWHGEVAPILSENCTGCHRDGGVGGFALDDVSTASAMAPAIAEATASRRMPPWGAQDTDECAPRVGWKNDARLDDAQIALISAWAEAGAPEGDPAEAVALPEPADPSLDAFDVELRPQEPYLTGGADDEIVCLSIDPGLQQAVWVTGAEVVPDNLAVVHHAVVMVDPHGESAALAGEDGAYDCFSGAGVSDETVVAVWVPGAFPTEPPSGSGFPVAASSRIVLQMHYHPAGREAEPDATAVRLAYTTQKPAKSAYLTGVGNSWNERTGLLPDPDDRRRQGVEFRVPANLPAHVEQMEIDFSEVEGRYDLWAMEAHMHMVGVDMLATVVHEDGDEECLIHEPAWDFDWQRLYVYDGPGVTLGGGDLVKLRCEYDNTLDNPGVVRALADAGETEPRDVYLGESSYDEMCILIFGITY